MRRPGVRIPSAPPDGKDPDVPVVRVLHGAGGVARKAQPPRARCVGSRPTPGGLLGSAPSDERPPTRVRHPCAVHRGDALSVRGGTKLVARGCAWRHVGGRLEVRRPAHQKPASVDCRARRTRSWTARRRSSRSAQQGVGPRAARPKAPDAVCRPAPAPTARARSGTRPPETTPAPRPRGCRCRSGSRR
jgi:hypothetical protein